MLQLQKSLPVLNSVTGELQHSAQFQTETDAVIAPNGFKFMSAEIVEIQAEIATLCQPAQSHKSTPGSSKSYFRRSFSPLPDFIPNPFNRCSEIDACRKQLAKKIKNYIRKNRNDKGFVVFTQLLNHISINHRLLGYHKKADFLMDIPGIIVHKHPYVLLSLVEDSNTDEIATFPSRAHKTKIELTHQVHQNVYHYFKVERGAKNVAVVNKENGTSIAISCLTMKLLEKLPFVIKDVLKSVQIDQFSLRFALRKGIPPARSKKGITLHFNLVYDQDYKHVFKGLKKHGMKPRHIGKKHRRFNTLQYVHTERFGNRQVSKSMQERWQDASLSGTTSVADESIFMKSTKSTYASVVSGRNMTSGASCDVDYVDMLANGPINGFLRSSFFRGQDEEEDDFLDPQNVPQNLYDVTQQLDEMFQQRHSDYGFIGMNPVERAWGITRSSLDEDSSDGIVSMKIRIPLDDRPLRISINKTTMRLTEESLEDLNSILEQI